MDLATNNLPVGSEVRTGVKDLSLMFDDVSNMLAKLQDEIIPEELDKQES